MNILKTFHIGVVSSNKNCKMQELYEFNFLLLTSFNYCQGALYPNILFTWRCSWKELQFNITCKKIKKWICKRCSKLYNHLKLTPFTFTWWIIIYNKAICSKEIEAQKRVALSKLKKIQFVSSISLHLTLQNTLHEMKRSLMNIIRLVRVTLYFTTSFSEKYGLSETAKRNVRVCVTKKSSSQFLGSSNLNISRFYLSLKSLPFLQFFFVCYLDKITFLKNRASVENLLLWIMPHSNGFITFIHRVWYLFYPVVI